ncbi:MAG: ATP-binding protein [Oscillospiraceae bacterium]|nr:ATP-binding protein [Oscillospiraceae bacterium]
MFVGDKKRINLTQSQFSGYIEDNCLYIDKTAFIEHVLQDANKIILITRPRRMGKSLNLDTLKTFLDFNVDSQQLFSNLYIKQSPVFSAINTYPVIYLNLKDIDTSSLDGALNSMRRKILTVIDSFFDLDNPPALLRKYCLDDSAIDMTIFTTVTACIAKKYQRKAFVLIDEYDKVTVDTANSPDKASIHARLVQLLSSLLKDNPNVERAVLTGVTRLSQDSLLSGLNNIAVYDIFTPSVYDDDFSLTHEEISEILTHDQLSAVRAWYNNVQVGHSALYNIYSVMSYLHYGTLKNYWTMSGTAKILGQLMTEKRLGEINQMITGNASVIMAVSEKLVVNVFDEGGGYRCPDDMFYSLMIQSGYLSYKPSAAAIPDLMNLEVCIPNFEARQALATIITQYVYCTDTPRLAEIFKLLPNTELFSKKLEEAVSMCLSYFDMDSQAPEKMYHVMFYGMMFMSGYTCASNRESGMGRYDILARSDFNNIIFEFKAADYKEQMPKLASEAIEQINRGRYWHEIKDSTLPLYKIGIVCHGKMCLVKAVLHDN